MFWNNYCRTRWVNSKKQDIGNLGKVQYSHQLRKTLVLNDKFVGPASDFPWVGRCLCILYLIELCKLGYLLRFIFNTVIFYSWIATPHPPPKKIISATHGHLPSFLVHHQPPRSHFFPVHEHIKVVISWATCIVTEITLRRELSEITCLLGSFYLAVWNLESQRLI